MSSYLVLTPPGVPRNDEKARFIRDQLTFLGFVFPAIWLFSQRQWLAGFVVAVVQTLIAIVSTSPDAALAAFLIELSLRFLVALEGPAFVVRQLENKGWVLRAIIACDDLTTAEMIYDSTQPDEDRSGSETKDWRPHLPGRADAGSKASPAFGLFGSYGER